MCDNSFSLRNDFGRQGNESVPLYTYITLNIHRGLKLIHKDSQHALIVELQLTVVLLWYRGNPKLK